MRRQRWRARDGSGVVVVLSIDDGEVEVENLAGGGPGMIDEDRLRRDFQREAIWRCKVGGLVGEMDSGADQPMREAIEAVFAEVADANPEFCFSGWGGELTEGERAAAESRMPDPGKTELLPGEAVALLAILNGELDPDWPESIASIVPKLRHLSEQPEP